MSARTILGLTTLLLAGATTLAHADGPLPRAFRSLKPFQVVEQIMAQREVLNLSDQQFARLDDLSLAIQAEKHRFTHRGGKPHQTRHVPMVSRREAFDRAVAILTPEQQSKLEWVFPAPAPIRSAARRVPAHPGKP